MLGTKELADKIRNLKVGNCFNLSICISPEMIDMLVNYLERLSAIDEVTPEDAKKIRDNYGIVDPDDIDPNKPTDIIGSDVRTLLSIIDQLGLELSAEKARANMAEKALDCSRAEVTRLNRKISELLKKPCFVCNGLGSIASDEPYMMMASVPCWNCSPDKK